ncbi:MAG TPA: oligosaccharide flippase family protein [Verrucomicrobiae bacterium]|nr:oligosaccharide flippase family protein [Verrucomicrobiae bacterium]
MSATADITSQATAATDLTSEEVKRHIYRNSISNYAFLVVRLGLGAVLFRLIIQELPAEDFGFWSVLWSMLGYGILLDFGFGFTAQKRVAELCVKRDWDCLSKVLSTIFYTYVGIALGIIVVGYFAAPLIIKALAGVSPANVERYTLILRVFLVGIGIAFPLGIFPEMLRGQQRICLANNLQLVSYLVSFTCILLCLANNWNLLWLFVFSLGGTLLGDLLCGVAAMRRMPTVVLAPRLFSRAMIRETTRFSVYAYINTLTTVILTRTDQIVISTGLALASVAIYQAGAKVAEMFSGFALQIAETLSPAAAHFHASGDRTGLRDLLVKGTRFTVLVATPMYLCCAFFLTPLLKLLTGSLPPTETFWVGQILLLWIYMTVLTQSVTKRVFMMCGHEKRLMWLGLGEAGMNLALSVTLVLIFKNVLCVAVGSLVATCFFGWLFIWPWAAKEAGIGSWKLARAVLFPAWVACWPLIGLIAIIRFMPRLYRSDSLGLFMIEAMIAGAVAAVGLWKLALDDDERAKFSGYFLSRFGRRSAA